MVKTRYASIGKKGLKIFSKEKERLPYGGVIQGYDEKLLKNICEKKLKNTAISNKLMEYIDEFKIKL